MRPKTLQTKIFLDSGDPKDTEAMISTLGFLDGQTTNPSLIAGSPGAKERLARGEKFSKEELLTFYKETIQKVSLLIPDGSVSIEVYADDATSAEDMFSQGKEMFSWIANAHIKYPTTKEGLKAANMSITEGMRVNMTLCFTQEQAAAVYAATKGAKRGEVFVSPFVGRLDDRGENGMSLIANIIKMYKKGDGHVEVLTASVRTLDHFTHSLSFSSDIITSPEKILKEWADKGMPLTEDIKHEKNDLKDIPYREIDLSQAWEGFDISHDSTNKGIERFSADWNNLLK
ncbi:MAG: transaldolase [bacterium]|nr:transaldolase [bacterium]